MTQFWFKSCPKCRGDLHVDEDGYGRRLSCIQCGAEMPLPDTTKSDKPYLEETRGTTPWRPVRRFKGIADLGPWLPGEQSLRVE